MSAQFLLDQMRQALYPYRTDRVFKENSVEVSLVAKMLEKTYQALGSEIALNTGCQSSAKSVEAMFEEIPLAREMQVEGRPASVAPCAILGSCHLP
jgi:hypothetical protein